MRRYNFATLVTHDPAGLVASHLPFIINRTGNELPVLFAHLARANRQWEHFDADGEALVIFEGPHASKRPDLELPGCARLRTGKRHSRLGGNSQARLELVAQHEAGRREPWTPDLPEDFMQSMLTQIVAIRIEITKIESKFKLGQNRSRADRENMAVVFEASANTSIGQLGAATWRTLDGQAPVGGSQP